jgi:ATP-binding cassette, subfamily F, member 3
VKRYDDNVVFGSADLLVERGDRLALVGPNGAGKSTLMRMLSGVEAPDSGERTEGHQVVMQYFAQDEASRLDPSLTVYETLETGSPNNMVPAIRNILGGFLFSGDDVYKRAGVLSGGERTRLAVARMLLRPSNTLLLDEPTNHLDLDSKDVLLEALEDFGGTLIFVSHDRYFVDRLATKIVEVGGGRLTVYPGTYEEFRWSKQARKNSAAPVAAPASKPAVAKAKRDARLPRPPVGDPKAANAHKKNADKKRIEALEAQIAEREQAIKELEASMATPGFYDDRQAAKPIIDRHQALMWEVGDLMHQWEELSSD